MNDKTKITTNTYNDAFKDHIKGERVGKTRRAALEILLTDRGLYARPDVRNTKSATQIEGIIEGSSVQAARAETEIQEAGATEGPSVQTARAETEIQENIITEVIDGRTRKGFFTVEEMQKISQGLDNLEKKLKLLKDVEESAPEGPNPSKLLQELQREDSSPSDKSQITRQIAQSLKKRQILIFDVRDQLLQIDKNYGNIRRKLFKSYFSYKSYTVSKELRAKYKLLLKETAEEAKRISDLINQFKNMEQKTLLARLDQIEQKQKDQDLSIAQIGERLNINKMELSARLDQIEQQQKDQDLSIAQIGERLNKLEERMNQADDTQKIITQIKERRVEIEKMPIPQQRPEWQKLIDRLPKEHDRHYQTKIMNETLRPEERFYYDGLAQNMYNTQQRDIDQLMAEWEKVIDILPEEHERRYETYIRKRALMFIHIRSEIKKMPILQQRPEWLKLIDDQTPDEYKAYEIDGMNKILISQERDFFINNAMKPDIDIQVDEWLNNLPDSHRENETKFMKEYVLMENESKTSMYT